MDATHVICAMLEVRRCRTELYVNGFPVLRLGPDGIVGAAAPVQQYLIPGSNELELLVEPGKQPSRARTQEREFDRGDATATGRLIRFPDGAMTEVENGELLAEVSWSGCEAGDGEPERLTSTRRFPKSLSREVQLGTVAGRWSWQDAPVLEISQALISEASGVLQEIADALRSGSGPAYGAIVEIAAKEGLRAYPARNAQTVADDHARFAAYFASSADPVVPLDRERFDFRLVAGGRVLECVDIDFQPSVKLREPKTGEVLPFEMFLARIEGKLRVVR